MADLTAAARGIWWLVLLRGILAILFGLFALFAPGTALLALVFVFGAYAILDGITALAVGIRHRKDDPHWVWHVVQGVVSVLAGSSPSPGRASRCWQSSSSSRSGAS